MPFAPVFNALGWLAALFGGLMLVPALAGLFEGDGRLAGGFAGCAVLTGFVGGAIAVATRGRVADGEFDARSAYLFVCLSWLLLSAAGALPLYILIEPLSLLDALFEACSGITTTGASVFTDPSGLSRPVLLWRGLMQWAGGLWSIVVLVAVLSHFPLGGLNLFQSAMTSHEGSTVVARLADVGRQVAGVYGLLTGLCAGLLWLSGLGGFEALAIALSTVSAGGFSTAPGSDPAQGRVLVEVVLIGFMLLAATNFTLHIALLQGRPGRYLGDREFGYVAAISLLAALALALLLIVLAARDPASALRIGAFHAASFLSTTGYTNSAPDVLSLHAPVLLLGLILAGGSFGSSAGGIKLIRIAVLFKQAQRELLRLSHPHGVVLLRIGRIRITDPVIRAVWSFFCLFFACHVLIALALAFCGLSAVPALTAAAAALSNTGPALATIAPDALSYGAMSAPMKLWLGFGMILGRIEILTLFALAIPAYWRD